MSRLRARRESPGVVEAMREIADDLRAGRSLRQAIEHTSGRAGSPLAPTAAALAAGRPLVSSLREAAARHAADGEADISSALCILAVHAEAGGDPLPATRALADRLARRAAARAEARALTTQARLGARALLFLTPAFLFLVVASDPSGVVRWLAQPSTRLAVIAGVTLQLLGALWMRAIVGNAAGATSRFVHVPLARALRALLAGRSRSPVDEQVAAGAETMAFVLDAGLSPSAGVATVAPFAPGAFGEALRRAAADVGSVPGDAVRHAFADLEGAGAARFVAAYTSSVSLGVPLAPVLRSLADELRERSSIMLAEDIRRASVRVLVPLGLLILPAFVLSCLVPLFVGGIQGLDL